MPKRDQQIRIVIHQWMDACLFAVAFWLAFALRTDPMVMQWLGLPRPPRSFEDYLWLYLIMIPAAPLVLEANGFYRRPLLGPRWNAVRSLVQGCVIICMGVTLMLFFARLDMARWTIIWFGGIAFVLVFAKEEILRALFRSRIAQAQYRKRFILVGVPGEIAQLRRQIAAHPDEGLDVVAQVDLSREPVGKLVELLHEHSVNGVIISAEHTHFEHIEAAIRACEIEGIEAWLVADFFRTQISRTSLDDFYGRPVLVFRATPEVSWQSVVKQVADFMLAGLLLSICFPLLVVVAVLIKITSPGPVFFRQQRAGLNGQPFTMFKFRTMVSNAEQLKHELAVLNEMSGPVFKITKDPRITPLGRLLRRYSIDELPQLLNVLRGEMSLVGPRPLPVDEVKRFDDVAHRRRLSVRPGLTCLWQVSGRNEVKDFKEWVRLDLEYIDNWSLWLDLKILLRTIPVVLTAKGAK